MNLTQQLKCRAITQYKWETFNRFTSVPIVNIGINLTFFVLPSTRSEGYSFSENHDFTLPRCLTKSNS